MPIAQHEESGFFNVELEDRTVQVPRFCPHRGGRLDHGQVNYSRQTLSCPLHRSVFSLQDGRQLSGPPCGDLDVTPCTSVQMPLADSLEQN